MKSFSEELANTAKAAGAWLFGPPWHAEIFIAMLAVVIWLAMVPKPLRAKPLYWVMSIVIATLAVVVGAAAGVVVGFAIMFGPSYATGDFIGLPWLTMLPALALGGLAGFAGFALAFMLGSWVLRKVAAREPAERSKVFKLYPDD